MKSFKTGNLILSDLKQLWFDFKWIYPSAFNRIFANWQVSLFCLFLIFSSFLLDDAVYAIVTGIKSEFWDTLFSFGRWYGSGNPTLYIFAGLYMLGLFYQKQKMRDAGLLIGESFVFAGFITILFKSLFGRWRPFTNQGDFSFYGFTLSDNDHLSFSSGHANVAFALSAVLASTTNNIYLKILYYTPAVITCVSRIYHDQHWLSDVVTGAIIALLITKVLINFHKVRYKETALKTAAR